MQKTLIGGALIIALGGGSIAITSAINNKTKKVFLPIPETPTLPPAPPISYEENQSSDSEDEGVKSTDSL